MTGGTSSGRRTVTGLGLVVAGALLGMLAMTALPWFRGTLGGILAYGSKPSGLRSLLEIYAAEEQGAARGFVDVGVAKPYFAWLAIVMLAAAVLAAIVAAGSDPRSTGARAGTGLSVAAALAGLVLTGFAIELIAFDDQQAPAAGIRPSTPGYGDYLAATGIGAWAMTLAFLLIGVGAVLAAGGRDDLRTLLSGDETAAEQEVGPEPQVDAEPASREDW